MPENLRDRNDHYNFAVVSDGEMTNAFVFHRVDCLDDRLESINRHRWRLYALFEPCGKIDATRDGVSGQVCIRDGLNQSLSTNVTFNSTRYSVIFPFSISTF